jgi:D-psicose/D-tagatose/L-ribulose 3-epimerase
MVTFAASVWIWESPITDEVLDNLVPKLAAWGFDAVELPLEAVGDWSATRAQDLLRSVGLSASVCAVMPDGRDLSTTDAFIVSATQDYLRTCVDVAEKVGSAVVAGPIYAPVGKTWLLGPTERDEMLDRIAAGLRPVAQYAADRGVRLGVEPLNRYETSLINTLEQAAELVNRVNSPGIGITADTFHMNIEERGIRAALESTGQHIVHVQVAGNDRGTPGGDHFDWSGFSAGLASISYSGLIAIESFTALNKTIARAASVWRPLARQQDDIAVDGLAFLRQLLSRATPTTG